MEKIEKPDLGLDIRSEILETALWMENFSSIFVGSLLGIKEIKNSRTLGSKSSSSGCVC
jgi:hypothetical protein